MSTLEIVDYRQDREVVRIGETEAAVGETVSRLVLRIPGSGRLFVVRVPNEMYDLLGWEQAAPVRPQTGRRYDDVDKMIADLAGDAKKTGHTFLSADNPELRTIGFVDTDSDEPGGIYFVPLTVVGGVRHPLLREHFTSAEGRKKIAACLTHGHGPSEWDACEHCAAVLAGKA